MYKSQLYRSIYSTEEPDFMPGKGTTDAIFIMQQVQEKHEAMKKKMYCVLVDLEKAFDRVPRELVEMGFEKAGCG